MKNKSEFSAQDILSNADLMACRDRWQLVKLARQLKNSPDDGELRRLNDRYNESVDWVEQRKNQVPDISISSELPVGERAAEIAEVLNQSQVVILAGETGSGKTTQLPKICLQIGRGQRGMIGHTQPRRLAARAVASRIADELNVQVGALVGCHVRFHDQFQDATQIKLMTDGILLAEMQQDRFLSRYDTLIIDEAHERSLNIDFLLGYIKQILPKRPDLKVIITSATIDLEKFSRHFDNAPVVEVSGRTYPVDTRYYPPDRWATEDEPTPDLSQQVVHATREILSLEKKGDSPGKGGDILVFLPGEREIRDAAEALRKSQINHLDVLPLYARLSASDQNRVFASHTGRRVVLATNVAETSITVPGISYVIDPGVARVSRYSYRSKVQRLPIEPVSRASANQRAGRCGRVAPGLCIRLYSEQDYMARPEFTDAEILRTNLASVILQLLSLNLGDIEKFPLVDPPDQRFIKDGYTLLRELGAVNDQRRITGLGRKLARLPVDPRLGRMLIEANNQGSVAEVLIIASALAIQDPRERPTEKQQQADQKHLQDQDENSDFLSLVNLWNRYEVQRQELSRSQLRKYCQQEYIHYLRMLEWRDVHRQLVLSCRQIGIHQNQSEAIYSQVHKALLAGLLSQIAQVKEDRQYVAARGRICRIHPSSILRRKSRKWIIAAELVETSQLFARTVAKIEPEWLEPLAGHLVKKSYFEPHWEQKAGQVKADEQVSLYGLIIVPRRKVHYGTVNPKEARQIFIQSALVERQLNTRSPFWLHNQTVIGQIEDLEDKSRRRDILVEDSVLFEFYDRHIPEEIVNQAGFEKWLKQGGDEQLHLHEEDLVQQNIDSVSTGDYPDMLHWQGMRFPLKYHFMPGAEDDGVSLELPAAAINLIPEMRLDWLVPGLIREKCIALVKGLPKVLRKNFVPVPDFVSAALENMPFGQGDLKQNLAGRLLKMTGVRIPDDAWGNTPLPDHLRMNIRLLDDKGKQISQGRDLSQIRRSEPAPSILDPQSEDSDSEIILTQMPPNPLPVERVIKRAGIDLIVYPALMPKGEGVVIADLDTREYAEIQHEQGLIRLVEIELHQSCQYFLKQLKNLKTLELLYAPIGKADQFRKDMVAGAIKQTFIGPWTSEFSLPRSSENWQQFIDAGRGQFHDQAMRIAQLVHDILKQRTAIVKQLKGKMTLQQAFIYSDIQFQIDQLIHPGFITDTPREWLEQIPRYMKAIDVRLNRNSGIPASESMTVESLKKYWEKYTQKKDAYYAQQRVVTGLTEFRWMLEEYRVSLFAQRLGTVKSVSAKRLDKMWKELPD